LADSLKLYVEVVSCNTHPNMSHVMCTSVCLDEGDVDWDDVATAGGACKRSDVDATDRTQWDESATDR